jgi:DNA-binding LacI/PurR family transcriptional regulator/anti-anti-sigma regulatory factor/putative methionine-R-sulfoxide reductase with GAF domain
MGDDSRTNEMESGDPQNARPEGRRLTIGYLAPAVHGGSLEQWLGVVDAARKHDVNLICFPGRSLHFPSGFDAQANIIYDLVGSENVDGLVTWASAIGNYVTGKEIQAFHERYRPLPMVSTGRVLEGIPGLLMDSYEGMREAIVHLIEVHGCRHMAFIRGPKGHFYAQERYRAYLETLGAYGISFDPNLVTPPAMWGLDKGAEGMRLLLDERKQRPGTDFEAVIAANDEMIIGAWDVLQARGVRVPGDVAVVGFDDRLEGRARTPPLTSVASPFYETGYQSVETLLALMKGEPVPEEVIVPSRLVVRQTCGCMGAVVARVALGRQSVADRAGASRENLDSVLSTQREGIRAAMVQVVEDVGGSLDVALAERLLDGFAVELKEESEGDFLVALNESLRRVVEGGGDDLESSVTAMQNAISVLRHSLLPCLSDEALTQAEDLWQQARLVIGETAQRVYLQQAIQTAHQTQSLREIGSSLITAFDVENLADVLAEDLPVLGIPSAYLVLYEQFPGFGAGRQPLYAYPDPAPEWSRLVMAYTEDGRVALEVGGMRFGSHRLVPDDLWPRERRYSYVVDSLRFREHQIGFVLFEVGPRDGDVYDVLRGEISSALQGSLLREQVEERAVQLQTAAEVSQATSSILEPEALIEQVVDLARERFDLYYVGLFLVEDASSPDGDAKERWAVLKAGTGEAGQQMVALDHRLLVGGESMIGQCVAGKKALIALDVGEEAVRFENPLLPETRSELALPLISRGEAIGALTIQSVQEAAFSEEDISVMQTMADQLANAIVNARLYERVQQAYAEVEQQVRKRTEELRREQEESARLQQEVIEAQKRAIQELSTPIIPVMEHVIVMPLIGSIDTMRARDVTRRLLAGIREHRARVVILDITGVPIVDSGVAAYLNKTIQAARLKGARAIVTGVSDAVAETIVDMGIDWSGIETVADLQTGLRAALRSR